MGLGTAFFIGLAWVVWYVERASRQIADERRLRRKTAGTAAMDAPRSSWDPRDPEAWYYGRRSQKLAQSLTTLFGYSLAFFFKTAAFRDDDNADGSCKAYRDGIAQALGIDDKTFKKIKLSTHAKDAANPRVEITIYTKETP